MIQNLGSQKHSEPSTFKFFSFFCVKQSIHEHKILVCFFKLISIKMVEPDLILVIPLANE